MARFPSLSSPARSLRESIFARLAGRLGAYRGKVYPFHIGDTFRAPPECARLAARDDLDDPALYRYGAPSGEAALLAALADKCRRKNALGWADASTVQVTTGATQAVAAAVRAVLDPGDDLLVLAPYWPLIHGIATSAGVGVVEVDATQALYADPSVDLYALLAARETPRTRAVYFISPNNPDGKVLSDAALDAIARYARDRDAWVIADEVYEDIVFAGAHRSIASLPDMAERTITAFSLSKSYALAGLRLGYVVADPRVLSTLRKLVNHAVYNVPVALQRAGLAAVERGDEWLTRARADYRDARDLAHRLTPTPHHLPDGGAYLFLDLRACLPRLPDGDDTGVLRLHDQLLDAGVALAPGAAFGSRYVDHARLCYTAVPPEKLQPGLERLAAVLETARHHAAD